jgi:hypothetical protein
MSPGDNSTWIVAVGNSSVANSGDADGLLTVGQLVENPIGADAQRIEPAQLAFERMSRAWLALKQAQGILDCVDQRPVEFEQLPPGATSEDKSGQ